MREARTWTYRRGSRLLLILLDALLAEGLVPVDDREMEATE
jgi:hypothetical protein